ncbi:NADH dehydrogenase I chain E [Salmonella enterica subsp. diarizonae]|uniref:NADH dehydrogenase I chain E n=1 Tax=Salmonella diarizonae TaxID=59204 RepID=A0A379TXB7_SALDZ|nr:NADH dehydrogenase I chain E [Salmonella enterica subsp. diarizonae]
MHENQQPQTEAFELSAAEREAIEHEKHHYEDPRAASIEALKIVSEAAWLGAGRRDLRYCRCAGYSGERRRRRRHILQPDLPVSRSVAT